MENNIDLMREYFNNNYPGYNIKVIGRSHRDGLINYVSMKKDDEEKYVYYNHDLERIVSNLVDGSYPITLPYGNVYTLNSYKVGNYIRSFLAITNIDHSEVLLVGYDLNNKEYIEFPIDENGLIDDYEMIQTIKQEKDNVGVDRLTYNNYLKLNNIFYIMKYLNVEDGFKVCHELLEYNRDRIEELVKNSVERIRGKRR